MSGSKSEVQDLGCLLKQFVFETLIDNSSEFNPNSVRELTVPTAKISSGYNFFRNFYDSLLYRNCFEQKVIGTICDIFVKNPALRSFLQTLKELKVDC